MAAASSRHIEVLLPTATTHTGASASTWTVAATTAGYATKTGATTSTWTFTKAVAGYATKTGATASTWTFSATTAAAKTTAGATTSTWTFNATTAGAIAGEPTTIAGGGRIRQPVIQPIPEGPPLRLHPQPARVHVRAIAPRLTIGLIITSPTLRAKAHSATPTLTIGMTPAKVDMLYRAQRDLSSTDLDRELAMLLEA